MSSDPRRDLFTGRREESPQQQIEPHGQTEVLFKEESNVRAEEYRAAQRAAVESILVGRVTLETAVRQGEQLQNAENLADETEYKLDKANRLLKGMTWVGWLSNKLSKDVEPPRYNADGTIQRGAWSSLGPPKVYENVPLSCKTATQAIQNYHANLHVLEDCETEEQIATCKLICDRMHENAVLEVQKLQKSNASNTTKDNKTSQEFTSRLQSDVETLRQRQLALQQIRRDFSENLNDVDKEKLFSDANIHQENEKSKDLSSPLDHVAMQQDEHLKTIGQHLSELGSLAGNLNTALAKHADTLDSLDEKSESMLFKTKMVTRRADRLIQSKAWVKETVVFIMNAYIQHQQTGKYFSVAPNNETTLVLSEVLNERCIFGIWKRKQVYGLQNQYNMRWAGQSLLGQLTCSASTFGRREEWDMDNFTDGDNNWSKPTTLVLSSAGWGHGGFLLLDESGGNKPRVGGGTLDDKKKAPLWIIKEFKKKSKVLSFQP